MPHKSDDLDKWVSILSTLAQSKNGTSDEEQLGLSFYAIRKKAVSDYYKLNEILDQMIERGVIKITEDEETTDGEGKPIKRYQITLKGMKLLVEILIPARKALRGIE